MAEENYTNVILEEARGQYKAIQEGLDALQTVPDDVAQLKTDMSELKSNIQTIKGVVSIHSADIAELKTHSH